MTALTETKNDALAGASSKCIVGEPAKVTPIPDSTPTYSMMQHPAVKADMPQEPKDDPTSTYLNRVMTGTETLDELLAISLLKDIATAYGVLYEYPNELVIPRRENFIRQVQRTEGNKLGAKFIASSTWAERWTGDPEQIKEHFPGVGEVEIK